MPTDTELRRLVTQLLGREPAVPFRISQLCPYGWPAVILSDSYDAAGRPNPNIYYLVCPHLTRALSRLEDLGFMRRLEERIAADPELAKDLRDAQGQHALLWQRTACPPASQPQEQRSSVEETPPAQERNEAGRIRITPPIIAASGDELRLKCLHAHYAWFLAHPGYGIGKIIAAELAAGLWCPDEQCLEMYRKMENA